MLNFPEKEKEILTFWEKEKIFEKSLEKTKRGKIFVFYEGPPTANGKPGIHHVLARAYKDIILRYKTMQGFYVPRRAGWDTHGLPVELEVEKELGLNSKKDIEAYGVEKFVQKCKESVWRYKEEWEELTKRMGFWIDLENPYITYETRYIESLWFIIKQFYEKRLLEESFKVVPWCYRCGTPLSSHEVAQGYKKVTDLSLYVKFRIKNQGSRIKALNTHSPVFILSWTTTPWTLPGNVALAVGKDIDYVIWKTEKETFIIAKEIQEKNPALLPQKAGLITNTAPTLYPSEYVKGKELVGLPYEPLFDVPQLRNEKSHKIYSADFVTTKEGTGVVHTAVMYGEDDYELGTKADLPKFHTVTEEGKFIDSLEHGLAGLPVKSKEAEEKIIQHLKDKGLFFATENYLHNYPFCWRCKEPLLYYATKTWFVKTTKVKEALINNNTQINWVPSHIKEGRFGKFLEEVKDWAFSRSRYWGTPLPVWRCEKCSSIEVIGSLEELRERALSNGNYFFLVRHGEAENNVEDILSDYPEQKEYPLTQKGIAQARKAAKILKEKGIDVVVTSPVLRASQTAKIIAKATGASIFEDERFREISFGPFDGKSEEEYDAYWGSDEKRFTKESKPGMENFHQLRVRVFNALQELNTRYKGKRIAIVTHEACLWVLQGIFKGFSDKETASSIKDDFAKGHVRETVLPNLPFNSQGEVDLHRPFIDEVFLECKKCKAVMKRVREVCDVWFDSGAMPFAQAHFPFAKDTYERSECAAKAESQRAKRNDKLLAIGDLLFPADYICEAIDQTRGWFYTLLVVSTLLGFGPPYKNVISLGHVLDEKGRKMSKSLGNIVDPFEAGKEFGMDAIRWYFFVVNPAGFYKRFDPKEILSHQRRFLLALFNCANFLKLYGSTSKEVKEYINRYVQELPEKSLDRWMLSRLHEALSNVSELLSAYDITQAGRRLEAFVSDLSHWYIRRSRQRIKGPESYEVTAILYISLSRTIALTAPFIPFSAEVMFKEYLARFDWIEKRPQSIHLLDWPVANEKFIDIKLHEEMKQARDIASLHLAKRAQAGIPARYVTDSLSTTASFSYKDIPELIRQEVNVKKIETGTKEEKLNTSRSQELLEEGFIREIIRQTQDLRKRSELTPQDSIILFVGTSPAFQHVVERFTNEIKAKTGASKVIQGNIKEAIPTKTLNFEGKKVTIGIKLLT